MRKVDKFGFVAFWTVFTASVLFAALHFGLTTAILYGALLLMLSRIARGRR